ncbi:Penicillin-binding protein 1A/1B [Dermatophilus congolensis]|uniref:Penicillin-binding protein 1A/1B n=1 Tax=Dermatophilus congolensis TaxID=1863 RepID=A0AA46H1E8_9MICO|nr:transglycosylase domain-containing protein [Dermatophilus congolensis]STD15034.1 Penicillin-binding protein 1A/1B [Dermatophilus congolensis]
MRSRVVVGRGGKVRKGRFRALKVFSALVLSLIVLAIAGVVFAFVAIKVPNANEVAKQETSIFYYSDGKTEIGRTSSVNRVSVTQDQMPKLLQKAVLAAEDRSFYENPGVSFIGLGRAVVAMVTGGPTQGGSTITQQYVKNYFLTHDQTFARKGKELVIALKLEQEMSKDQILTDYLNTIYFGRLSYGVQAASQAYFNKDVKNLSTSEAIFLASIIQSPGNFDPSNGEKTVGRLKSRMKYVVDGMLEEGWISAEEARNVSVPQTVAPKRKVSLGGPGGYLVALARDELVSKAGIGEAELERGGLRVVTTIDKKAQDNAIQSVENNKPGEARIRTGLVSIKPGDGAIQALYGGSNFSKNPYSAAHQAQLQAGSTFKVFAVAAALEQEISTRTVLHGDSPHTFGSEITGAEPWDVRNYANVSYGNVSVRQALAHSVNTAFAELNFKVGPQKTKDMMVKLGIPENSPDLVASGSNVFGTASIRVIDLANAYATIAAKGMKAEPYIVKSVNDNVGVMKEYVASPSPTRVISEAVAADTIEAMRRVLSDEGTAKKASGLWFPAAGKTGTTDNSKAVWFGGFTPQASTAVALYMPDEKGIPQPMHGIGGKAELTGGTYPVSIWMGYMRRFMEGKHVIAFPERVGIGDSQVPSWSESTPPATPTGTSTTATTKPGESPTTDDSNGKEPKPTGVPTGTHSPAPTRGGSSSDRGRGKDRPSRPDPGDSDGEQSPREPGGYISGGASRLEE